MSTSDFNTGNFNWKIYASNIQSNPNQNLQFDISGNSSMIFRTSGTQRLRITDASSIFLNSVDLSANNLVNVNNLTVSRANPQTDASYNFTIVRIATNSTTRDTSIPTPYNGQACYILGGNQLQFYNNGSWFSFNPTTFISATGGTITNYTSGSTSYKVHTFDASGTFTINTLSNNSFYNNIDYLIVAGGGSVGRIGGGNFGDGGGGGAGGVLQSLGYGLTASGNYSVVVGLGGGVASVSSGSGQNSSLSTPLAVAIGTAIGGGVGGNTYTAGASGGSGGGAGNSNGGQGYGAGGSGTSGQGNAGGASAFNGAGGGGGAGSGGSNGNSTVGSNNSGNGNGGAGIQNSIQTGVNQYYSAGGGGSNPNGSNNGTGWSSSGYGMGGGWNSGTASLQTGRNGVVIIRYIVG